MNFLDHVAAEAQAEFREFAEPAVWTPQGGSATEICGIHDLISELIDIGEIIEQDGVAATLNVATSIVPGIAQDDTVTVRGSTYRVIGVEPDGTGRTIVVLGV